MVDDHELFRAGLVGLLEQRGIRVLGEAGLGAEGIRQTVELHPDVVLMDLSMPGMSGIEATQRLNTVAPLVHVLVLTVMTDEQYVMDVCWRAHPATCSKTRRSTRSSTGSGPRHAGSH